MDNNFENKLNELKNAYLKKLETTVQELENVFEQEEEKIKTVYLIVHKIAGTSGMYGLSKISNLSNGFEEYLKQNDGIINIEEFETKFIDYIEKLKDIILAGE